MCLHLRQVEEEEIRGEELQTPCTNLNFVSRRLSLYKFQLQGLGPASIGTVSKEHCLFQKNGGDKPARGVLALCTVSPVTLSLSLSLSLSG